MTHVCPGSELLPPTGQANDRASEDEWQRTRRQVLMKTVPGFRFLSRLARTAHAHDSNREPKSYDVLACGCEANVGRVSDSCSDGSMGLLDKFTGRSKMMAASFGAPTQEEADAWLPPCSTEVRRGSSASGCQRSTENLDFLLITPAIGMVVG